MKDYKKIINKHFKSFFARRHVIGMGYGQKKRGGETTGEESIVFLVDEKISPQRLRSQDLLPGSIENFSTDVREVGEIGFHNQRTERLRPASPGISIGHYKVSAGTFGAVVSDRKNNEKLILSNNHVLANITNGHDNRAEIGDPVLQPAVHDSGEKSKDVLAELDRFIPIYREKVDEPTCPVARSFEQLLNLFLHLLRPDYNLKLTKEGEENRVDCAVARPRQPGDLEENILDIGEIKGVADPKIGMPVKKSGRTSGVTESKIEVIDTTVEVNMDQSEKAIFHEQFVTGPMSRPGDSGSLMVNDDNRAVGLLFAGSNDATISNNINNVLDALEIDL
ncbi:MAG: hypothetical protein ACOCQB_01790 [Halanaerobiaceae bacterium]